MLSQRTLEVRIPKGVQTGSRVRIAGQGAPGIAGGPNGDVYLVIDVTDDPTFERQGNHLRQKLTIPFYTAVLGGEVVVPTLDGRVAMTVPEGTQDGRVSRLRGKGMPSLAPKSDVAGDILVEVHVAVPEKLTAEERDLFTKLRNLRQ
jgi:DnaJ-class molecular chaperone